MWPDVRLEEALDEILDHRGRTPKKLGSRFMESGIQVISAQNVTNNYLDLSATQRYVDDVTADRWMPLPLMNSDVLISSEAPLGRVARVPADAPRLCLGQRLFALRPKPHVLDPDFLAYALRSPRVQERLRARATGTTAQGIKQAELREVLLPLPHLAQQQTIASVLGAFDDKIESNRKLAETLATIVSTLATEGRLNQTRLPLREIAEQIRIPGSGDRPYVGLDDMPRGSPVLSNWKASDGPTGASWNFEIGDVLFGKLRPNLRKAGVALISGRCTREIVVLRPTKPAHFALLIATVTSERFVDHCISIASGTRMPRAEWKDASSFMVPLPSDERSAELTRLARTNYAAVGTLVAEIHTLTAIRDALLPKLISGQIRVPLSEDVEEQVGAALEAEAAA